MSGGACNPRAPQWHMGYTREGGGRWMVEQWPAMEEELCMSGGGCGFSVDLTTNNPNKR